MSFPAINNTIKLTVPDGTANSDIPDLIANLSFPDRNKFHECLCESRSLKVFNETLRNVVIRQASDRFANRENVNVSLEVKDILPNILSADTGLPYAHTTRLPTPNLAVFQHTVVAISNCSTKGRILSETKGFGY